MKTRQQWLSEYAVTHQNPLNKFIHVICVPVIMFSMLGALWCLRFPGWPAWLNGGVISGAFILAFFYARLGWGPLVRMSATVILMLALAFVVEAAGLPSLWIYSVLFFVSWIAQFYGHHVEGKKPSFFKDVQFLLVGPLWLFYRRG